MKSEVDPLITVPAAARAIGIDRSTLSKQVRSRAVRSHDGKVRLSEVLADRAANIDLTRSKRRQGRIDDLEPTNKVDPKIAEADAEPGDDGDIVIVDGQAMRYADARALKETYLARLKRLEFETKRGDLAPVGAMVSFVENVFGTVRERLLAIPGKLSGELEAEQVERLTAELYEAMDELSDPRNAFDGADPVSEGDFGDDDPSQAAAEAEPYRVGRALPVRRAEDVGGSRPLAHKRAADRVRPDAGRQRK